MFKCPMQHNAAAPFDFPKLTLCVWPIVQKQLESTRPCVVIKHQTQVKVMQEKVSDGGRRRGGSFKCCFGWLVFWYDPTHLAITKAHLYTTALSSPFPPLRPLVIQPPLPPRCCEMLWMRSRTWGAHQRENRCHLPLAARSGMFVCICVCVCVTGSMLWLKGKAGALLLEGHGMKWGLIRGKRHHDKKEIYENRSWM